MYSKQHMKAKLKLSIVFLFLISYAATAQTNKRVVVGYFPSWSENWTSANQNSSLREVPTFVNYVFLAFAKPNLTYVSGSYDISQTGIQVPYDGCTLKESISALKAKGTKVILSIGGETYWGSTDAYTIDYVQIKNLVDDMGFAGIDWDFEPNGTFSDIGSTDNVQHFIDFFNGARAVMPKSQGYILACAPSGVGALGGQNNDDANSPYAYAQRNNLTGESDANLYNGGAATNGINLFGFTATGHMIPVIKSVGDKIDLIAFQGYNVGGSVNRTIMYDAFAYYAEQYGFLVAAGTDYPDEPWGPYYAYSHDNMASLSGHIVQKPQRGDNNDGVMIWELLLKGSASSAYSYLNVASLVLNGSSESDAIQNANAFTMSPYTGGASGCNTNPVGGGGTYCGAQVYNASSSYAQANTQVFYLCKIWHNQWYANPNEIPGTNDVWVEVSDCTEGTGCGGSMSNEAPTVSITAPTNNAIYIAPASITFTANAEDADGTISKVEYYNGATLLGTVTSGSTYSYSWKNVAAGTYTITAKAYDNLNAVTTSSAITVKVTANQLPTVNITAPINNASYIAPASITFTSNAADVDGTISKVEYYNGAALLGTVTTGSTYSYSWTNVATGMYIITAKAYDNLNAVTTSSAITVKVIANQAPTVSIIAPQNNINVAINESIDITADASDSDGSVVKIEFYIVNTQIGESVTVPYTIAWQASNAGTYMIRAVVTDNSGAVSESDVTMHVNITTGIQYTQAIDLHFYPNPAKDVLYFDESIEKITVYSINGALVNEVSLNGLNYLTTSDLTSGMYVCEVVTKKGTAFIKILKE